MTEPTINPVLALLDFFKMTGLEVDEPSFERLAEGRALYTGIVLYNVNSVQAICERENLCIYTDRETGKITAIDASQWVDKPDFLS